jgi:hypothetical protein
MVQNYKTLRFKYVTLLCLIQFILYIHLNIQLNELDYNYSM